MKDSFARSKTGYIPTLDGWRAIAIAGVMLFHGGPLVPSMPFLSHLQTLGASGVELFFAISGILICTRLVDEEESRGGISLRNFYLRRLFRIQPAAMVYLLVIALLAALGMIAFSPAGWTTALLSVRNLYRSTNPASGAVYTAHFWSLAIEEHFYLLLPWLLILLRGRNRLRSFGILAVVSLLLNSWMERTAIARMPINSEFELCWLFLASWLALAIRRPAVRQWLTRYLLAGPTLLIVCLLGLGVVLKWPLVWHLWLPSFPLLLLATVLHPESLPGRFLESAPMRAMGRISYSLYLWQQLFCITLADSPQAKWPLGWMQQHPQCYVLPFICALASYFFVEKPLIAIGHRITRRVPPSASHGGARFIVVRKLSGPQGSALAR